MKTCTKCGKEKRLDEFYFENKSKNKRHSSCAVCSREYKSSPAGRLADKKYRENRGLWIKRESSCYMAYINSHRLKLCKTRSAAEQVIAKHKLREVKRRLEDEALLVDDYYKTL